MNRILPILFSITLMCSCIKIDFAGIFHSAKDAYYSKETEKGTNRFSFTIDHLRLYQITSGGAPSTSPPERFAKYSVNEETAVTTIYARLISSGYYVSTVPFPEITFTFSSELLESGAEFCEVETEFWYLYLPRLCHLDSEMMQITDREAEYQLVDVSETKIRIRKWSPEDCILAGNFTMTGQYTDSLGVVHPFVVNDGVFDLTDDYEGYNRDW